MTVMDLPALFVLVREAKQILYIKPGLLTPREGALGGGGWKACPCQLRAPGLFQGQRQERGMEPISNYCVPCVGRGESLHVNYST